MVAALESVRVEGDLDLQLGARQDRDSDRVMCLLQVSCRVDPDPVGTLLQGGDKGQVL